MVTTVFAFLLGCALQQEKPPPPKIEATIRETPAAAGKPAGFIVEGTTGYPPGSWLQVLMYFDRKDEPTLINDRTKILPGGTFSIPVSYFKGKNLAGSYVFTVEFNRFLQPPAFGTLLSNKVDVPYRSGTVLEAQEQRQAWKKKLLSEFQATLTIADEIGGLQRETLEKPDPERWKKSIADWGRRMGEIQKRAISSQENFAYRDLYGIASTNLEPLHGYILQMALLASQGKETAAEVGVGRTKVAATAAPHIEYLSRTEYTPGLLRALAEDTRRIVRESSSASGDALADSQSRIRTALLALGANVPENQKDQVRATLEAAVPYFAAVEAKAPNARELQAELDLRIQKLLAGLPAEK